MKLEAKIEAILFTAARAFSFKRLAELCEVDQTEIKSAAQALHDRLEKSGSALQLTMHGQEIELVTRPEVADVVRATVKDETQGELTRPSLEALAVLAYRGPMTRPELEQIRGVQCSLILRNLMTRGLVEMREDSRLGQPLYSVSLDFLKHLGADRVESLPDFESLHANSTVEQALAELQEAPPTSVETKLEV
ncbi:MAG: SMC-Scp complex subunit ScpB [Candidatus Uhrbacteria bacterium]|nr:SMC-Scp complex subunit ScpB [Candidatus Uhrbacteria bacterium]MDP3793652.1 SMC-Scp complex subunit ScpB [Candidatus Uhrbacteria bacterium]